MKNKLVWRLSKLPTADELRELVKDKIITQEEAREILFNNETEEDRDKKSLESEIKFLRELVERLSSSSTKIIETIREVEKPYYRLVWYKPYQHWCSSAAQVDGTVIGTTNAMYSTAGGGSLTFTADGQTNFSNIKTF